MGARAARASRAAMADYEGVERRRVEPAVAVRKDKKEVIMLTRDDSKFAFLIEPRALRWELAAIFVVLTVAAQTSGTVGVSLRAFSQILFP